MGLPFFASMPIWSSIVSITPSRRAATWEISIQSIVASGTGSVSAPRDVAGACPSAASDRAATKPAASAAVFFEKGMASLRGKLILGVVGGGGPGGKFFWGGGGGGGAGGAGWGGGAPPPPGAGLVYCRNGQRNRTVS